MTAVLRAPVFPTDALRRARLLFGEADLLDEERARWAPESAEGPEQRRAARSRRKELKRRAAGLRAEAEDVLLLAWRDGGDAEVNLLLASLYRLLHERAEAEGREDDAARWMQRLRRHDVAGRHAAWLAGTGRLELRTDPPGLPVGRIVEGPDGPVVEPLGVTPLEDASIPAGRHTLVVMAPSGEVRVPVLVPRAGRWTGPLLRLGVRPPAGFRLVPGGSFIYGGDTEGDYPLPASTPSLPSFAIATFPVTLGEYCDFLNDRLDADRDDTLRRVPRRVAPGGARALLRAVSGRPNAFDPSDLDPMGWRDMADHAGTGISFADAEAYAAWRSERDGVVYRLPTERQWEKAARGVDGRLFPWGDDFDESLCHMRYTFEGRPRARPVGTVDGDVSPYGVRDMAGGVLEWCRPGDDPLPGGGNPIRGGCWHSSTRPCRAADRFGAGPQYIDPALGFRLVAELDD